MSAFLERLSTQVPYHSQTQTTDVLGQLVRAHLEEIDQARREGYSWTQIKQAAQATWTGMGSWPNGERWTRTAIESRYRKIKKEGGKSNG